MNKICITFFAAILALSFSGTRLYAQETPAETEKLKHSIGAGAGFTTGYGLSYRYRPAKFGVQVNFAPYSNKDVSRFSTGVTFLYTLIENKMSNLYLYQGNHHYYESYLATYYTGQNSYSTQRFTENYFNNGLGVGIELIAAKRVGINIMGGYAAYRNFEQLNITGEVGVYYKF